MDKLDKKLELLPTRVCNRERLPAIAHKTFLRTWHVHTTVSMYTHCRAGPARCIQGHAHQNPRCSGDWHLQYSSTPYVQRIHLEGHLPQRHASHNGTKLSITLFKMQTCSMLATTPRSLRVQNFSNNKLQVLPARQLHCRIGKEPKETSTGDDSYSVSCFRPVRRLACVAAVPKYNRQQPDRLFGCSLVKHDFPLQKIEAPVRSGIPDGGPPVSERNWGQEQLNPKMKAESSDDSKKVPGSEFSATEVFRCVTALTCTLHGSVY